RGRGRRVPAGPRGTPRPARSAGRCPARGRAAARGSMRSLSWHSRLAWSHRAHRALGRVREVHVLIAPDCFTGTLTATQAAEAIAAGWRRRAPDDLLTLVPLSDGGPGFIDVLTAAQPGDS